MAIQDDTSVKSVVNDAEQDERLVEISLSARLLRRPELGAVAGLIAVLTFFAFTANSSMFSLSGAMSLGAPAAQLGILAVAAAMLMIGGEFDLSVGSTLAFTGMIFGACIVYWGVPLWGAVLITLGVSALIGFCNAQIVLRTGLPSFIVTLAGLFVYKGATLAGLKIITGITLISGVSDKAGDQWLAPFISGNAFEGPFAWMAAQGWLDTFKNGTPKVKGIPVEMIWVLIIAIVATYVLSRTNFGNWVYASGGDAEAARTTGVPVNRVKTVLFMGTSSAAGLVAIITVLTVGTADTLRGDQKEFEAIIAAVIGGCLLTGGYGSAVGALIGAVIFGIVKLGLTYTGFDLDYYLVFLGGMLLVAVLFNNFIRRRVTGET
ncbi:MAG: ABC transporter permease [Rhodobacteraceae bacterium]|nr:ABC transporter permease [Paracoccaceae bacterium]MCY4140462.1 ABC transporter permease [Paracoccaceae bacterium]